MLAVAVRVHMDSDYWLGGNPNRLYLKIEKTLDLSTN